MRFCLNYEILKKLSNMLESKTEQSKWYSHIVNPMLICRNLQKNCNCSFTIECKVWNFHTLTITKQKLFYVARWHIPQNKCLKFFKSFFVILTWKKLRFYEKNCWFPEFPRRYLAGVLAWFSRIFFPRLCSRIAGCPQLQKVKRNWL